MSRYLEQRAAKVSFILVLCLLAVAAAGVAGLSNATSDAEKPPLHIAADELDFGEAWATADFAWRLPIVNVSDREVHIRSLRTSCRCATVSPESAQIAKGATLIVDVRMNLLDTETLTTSGDGSTFTVEVLADVAADAPSPMLWTIQGRVKAPFTVEPSAIDFDDHTYPDLLTQTRSMHITLHADVRDVHVHADSADVRIDTESRDGLVYCTVSVTPERSAGPFEYRLLLTPTLSSGQVQPPIPVRISGLLLQDLQITPQALQVSSSCLQPTKPHRLTLAAAPGVDLSTICSSIERCDDELHVVLRCLDANVADSVREYEVVARSTDVGYYSANVRFDASLRDDDSMIGVNVPIVHKSTVPADR